MISHFVEEGAETLLFRNKECDEVYAILPFFEKSVILGDSLAESLLDYCLLRKNNVVAKRGRTIDMIDDDMEKVIQLSPRDLFMAYGKNDILHFEGNAKRFARIYRRKINYLNKALPNTNIYIHSLVPMQRENMEHVGGYQVLDDFNLELYNLCKELDVHYIDNTKLMQWNDDAVFEYDGVHPKYPFYPVWLYHMALSAGFIPCSI